MEAPLQHRVAIVTGSGGGLGRVIARTLAADGARVVVSDVDATRGQAVAAELGDVLFLRADIADPSSVDNLVGQTIERFGQSG